MACSQVDSRHVGNARGILRLQSVGFKVRKRLSGAYGCIYGSVFSVNGTGNRREIGVAWRCLISLDVR